MSIISVSVVLPRNRPHALLQPRMCVGIRRSRASRSTEGRCGRRTGGASAEPIQQVLKMQAQTLADAAHATTGRPSLPYPVAAHPFGRLLHTQQFQSETDQPFRVHMVDDHQEQAGAGIAFGEQVFALPESSPGGSPHQSLQFRFREVREQRFPENCSTVAADAQAFTAASYPRLLPHHTSGSYRLSSAARVAALFLLEIPRANGFASPERSGSKYRITI